MVNDETVNTVHVAVRTSIYDMKNLLESIGGVAVTLGLPTGPVTCEWPSSGFDSRPMHIIFASS